MSYGPQEVERYAQQKAEFDAKIAASKRRRGVPASIIARRNSTSTTGSSSAEPEVIVEEVEVGGGSSGGKKSQYITPNYEQHVFIALALSLTFVLLAAYYRGKNAADKPVNSYLDPKADPIKFAAGWIVVAFVLLAGARFRGADKLAATFAWLIFVSVLLLNGEEAYNALPTSHVNGGGGGNKKKHT